MNFAQLAAAWDRYLCTPRSPQTLGLFRLGLGLLLVVWCILLFPELPVWYSEHGVLSAATARAMSPGFHLNLFDWLPATDTVLWSVFASMAAAAVAVLLGVGSRLAIFWVWVCLTSFTHRNAFILNSGDTLLRLFTFYMMFAPADDTWSVTRLWRLARGADPLAVRPRQIFAQHLLQVQVALVYIGTALWKAKGSMWADGTAVYVASRLEDFKRIDIPILFEYLPFIKLMTWGTLAIEFALGTVVWFRDLRYPVLLLGVLLHLGIEVTMNIPIFEWVMILGLLAFVEPDDLARAGRWVRARVRSWVGAPTAVYWDGDCGFCQRSINVVRALDLLGRLEMHDFRRTAHPSGFDAERAERELLLRTGRGEWLGGFDAFRWMSWRLPLTMPVAWLLYLPGVPFAGRRVYRWIAANRHTLTDASCAVPV